MSLNRTLSLVFAAAFAITAHAQDCTGGPDGGMGATGNQCNEFEAMVAHAGDPRADALRERGLVEYAKGHYAAAIVHFRDAAELGDQRSAEILALMYRVGPRLYGDGVASDAAESDRWAAVATSSRPLPVASDKALSRANP